jgi:hypothetical protein
MNTIEPTLTEILKPDGCAPAKWFALIDDTPLAVPDPTVAVHVLKVQANVPADFVLVRDYNSPNDVVLKDGETIDLRHGNVFYTMRACEVGERGYCTAPAKLAIKVDDRAEEIGTRAQTGGSIRELFELPAGIQLFRDLHSRDDQPIEANAAANFDDGPVFYTRKHIVCLAIIVNKKRFTAADGVKPQMTGLEIAKLVSATPAETRVYKRTAGGRQEIEDLNKTVEIHDCDEFDVVRRRVDGGYEPSRIERELNILRSNGAKVTFAAEGSPAVIYHDLPVRPGHSVGTTDVLVPVPGGYPGQFLDWAFLPVGSPLIGKVPGATQGSAQALGKPWVQISYHPHNGGGGPPWNKDVHGFHTYIDELLSWLDKAQ